MLIQAMQVRYSPDSTESREKLNQLYVNKMKEAYEKYPADPDIAALYADGLMLQHPWDLWNTDGTPKPWTPEIRLILEKLLATAPSHPGANHYYIHVMEPSPFAAKAIPSADRLGKLTPALSHTVHMPSHIYLRTGDYEKGMVVNENAVNSYRKTISLFAPVTGNDFLYLIHNLHMQANNAMMAGRSSYAARSASETSNSISPDYLAEPGALGNYLQYISMVPVFVDIRFERWNELLSRRSPEPGQLYAKLLYHFGKGMAYANLTRINEAGAQLDTLRILMKDSVLALPFTPFSTALEGAVVAENLLEGTIALKDGRNNDAISSYSRAVSQEEKMVYNEPRDWLLNPLPYLAHALLAAENWKEAEQAFSKDLANNNENGWALSGLYKALLAQNRREEAKKVLVRFKKAFAKADPRLLKI
jgi:tetratricopeptide (TPR) repeat protein